MRVCVKLMMIYVIIIEPKMNVPAQQMIQTVKRWTAIRDNIHITKYKSTLNTDQEIELSSHTLIT